MLVRTMRGLSAPGIRFLLLVALAMLVIRPVADVAASDIATAIKFCKNSANSSRRAMYQLGRAYAANRQVPEAIATWRKAADKGSTSAMVR